MSSECPTCERTFKNERGVKQHHARTHGESLVKTDVGCENCSTVFKRRKYRVERREHNFCSRECKSDWQSENMVGEKSPTWGGGEIETECSNCSEEISVKPVRYKESGNYCSTKCFNETQGSPVDPQIYRGIRKFIGDKSWYRKSRSVRKENKECYLCGKTKNLHVHHIIPLRSGGTNKDWNLMVLCVFCHGTVERYTERIVETHIRD